MSEPGRELQTCHAVADDVIDLREVAAALLRHWRTISGVTLLSALVAFALSAFVIPPAYESSAVVVFRNTNPRFGIDFPAFQALASSPAVMEKVRQNAGIDGNIADLRRQFRFQADTPAPMLTVAVKAGDPYLAERLVHSWIEAMRSEVASMMMASVSEQLAVTESNNQAASALLFAAEEALLAFDREHPLDLMTARLDRLKDRLVKDEQALRDLTESVIPTKEATLESLQRSLSQESPMLGALAWSALEGVSITQLNPTYFELRRQVAELESALAADRLRAEILEEELAELRRRVTEAANELIRARLERERLVRELNDARSLFDATRRERDEILRLQRQLADRSRVEVVWDPVLPESPVSPRKALNAALASVLGAMAGIFGALLAEWWKTPGIPKKMPSV